MKWKRSETFFRWWSWKLRYIFFGYMYVYILDDIFARSQLITVICTHATCDNCNSKCADRHRIRLCLLQPAPASCLLGNLAAQKAKSQNRNRNQNQKLKSKSNRASRWTEWDNTSRLNQRQGSSVIKNGSRNRLERDIHWENIGET